MRTGLRSAVKIAAFLLILAVLLSGINGVLLPKSYLYNSYWPTTSSYRTFYTMDRNTVDVLFLGSSYCVNGFCPQEIYDSYGIRSYNLGSEQQSVFLSYYWLKEALRYQSPSVVVLEGKFMMPLHPENPINTVEGLTRKCLDPMRLSPVKIEAINALCAVDESQSKSSWYLTNIRFHDRWKSLSETDFDKSDATHSYLMGWGPGCNEKIDEYSPFVDSEEDWEFTFDGLMAEYFVKTAELCRQNGIKLIMINIPPIVVFPPVYHAYEKICRENDVDFYELAEESLWNELGAELPRENPVAHGNIWGNIKVSRYVGKLLAEKYAVAPVRDPQYEANHSFYEHVKTSFRLQEVTDIDEYLSVLKDPGFMVFISVKDEAANGLRDSTKEKLRELGFKKEWDKKRDYRKSYIGIITDEGITEESGGAISVSGVFRNKNSSYTVISRGYDDEGGARSSIVIDGTERSCNTRGLNIVVYDPVFRNAVDRVTFDTFFDSSARRK